MIFSARVGAGHDAVAAELAARLGEAGVEVERCDFLDTLPGPVGRMVLNSYQRMLSSAPWSWTALYRAIDNGPAVRLQARLVTMLAGRAMRRRVAGTSKASGGTRAAGFSGAAAAAGQVRRPTVAVATYPLAAQALGRMRAQGSLDVPAVTYLTDFSVHRVWVAEGVDRNLAVHQVPGAQAQEAGAAGVTVVAPVVDRRFTPGTPALRAAARVRWGLPQDARLALLVGGSWGAGEIERTVADIEATRTGTTCVVVCGRNEELRERLLASGLRHVHGWVEDMPSLMHAADVLVQNAGGISVLEAVNSGLPVITYRSIPGHGLTNSAALDEAGVARWVRSPDGLGEALEEAFLTHESYRSPHQTGVRSVVTLPGADPVAAVLEAAGVGARGRVPVVADERNTSTMPGPSSTTASSVAGTSALAAVAEQAR
ncbi:glycosyltransferase [Phaeacidiphilus oryzae]|uniref:glycosyltransferase n=1 Tax=Phaeacidiphilus oryzae TaxID=348818 RepID=UPI00068CEFC4|nr:glycosyltransferase [Phaeacidiphilus oryzae]